jgi:hypothetical protein
MSWVNRLGGAHSAGLQLDWLPGLGSAAFVTVTLAGDGERNTERLIATGQRLLRFWLTAARLNLALQPGFATLIFAFYGEKGTSFTRDQALLGEARRCADRLRAVTDETTDRMVFLARIGEPNGRPPRPRSVRLQWPELLARQAASTTSSDACQSEPPSVT